MTDAVPDMEAHSPEALMKDMLTWWSLVRSSVFPDSVLVLKSRSIPPVSCTHRRRQQEACA